MEETTCETRRKWDDNIKMCQGILRRRKIMSNDYIVVQVKHVKYMGCDKHITKMI